MNWISLLHRHLLHSVYFPSPETASYNDQVSHGNEQVTVQSYFMLREKGKSVAFLLSWMREKKLTLMLSSGQI